MRAREEEAICGRAAIVLTGWLGLHDGKPGGPADMSWDATRSRKCHLVRAAVEARRAAAADVSQPASGTEATGTA